jgi:adenylate kinase family enzyme
MKINIIGATSSGVTTLGEALAVITGLPLFDSDDYFWTPTTAPFTVRREAQERNQLLVNDLSSKNNYILSGPVFNWGIPGHINFDIVVFLYLPPQIRLARLKQREFERFGDIIFTDAERNRQYNDFVAFATKYEDNTANISRTLRDQRKWINTLTCKVVEIIGDTTVQERVKRVLVTINSI